MNIFKSFTQIIALSILLFPSLSFSEISDNSEDLIQNICAEGLVVDLRDPHYADGVLSTSGGGVISGPGLRIQAVKITYTQKIKEGKPVVKIVAEDQVMLEYQDNFFVGSYMEYDVQAKQGHINCARTAVEPWFFGGQRVDLYPDGSYEIQDAFITTSENQECDWQIEAQNLYVTERYNLCAKNVKFRFLSVPIFWLPSFNANIKSLLESPIRYQAGWGGHQGPRFGVIYEFYSTKYFKAFARVDYRLKRGFRWAIETNYDCPSRNEYFDTINYVARDTTVVDPSEKYRYRFAGRYYKMLASEKTTIQFSYDKLSDKEVPSDYDESGVAIRSPERTMFQFRHEETDWIYNAYMRVRINNFQTVKQELPTFSMSMRPLPLGETGIVFDSRVKVAYLDYRYVNGLPDLNDFQSFRTEWHPKAYRPFFWGPVVITPKAEAEVIYYGNSPDHCDKKLLVGILGCEAHTRLTRTFQCCRHNIEPYVNFEYYTFPSVEPNDHFIFDADDGWYRLNTVRVGVKNQVYVPNRTFFRRVILADLYTFGFINIPTIPSTVPKVYLEMSCKPLHCFQQGIDTAWDFSNNTLDHFNLISEITFSENVALAFEYRYRSPFCWRKADKFNFMLDAFHSEKELRLSSLSDQRETLLLHLFYRFRYNAALEFQIWNGWDRRDEPSYTEYQIDLITVLKSAWNVRVSFQHKVDDTRVAFYVSMRWNRP